MARHAAILLALIPYTLPAQTPKPAPNFEVASIRQTDPAAPRTQCYMRGQEGGKTYTGRCISLALIIKRAYRIVDSQLSGGPDWLNTTLFDFEAKTETPTTRADVEPLFQSFLAERFDLKMHTEPRSMQALVLTVNGAGNKMTPNTTDYEWEIPVQTAPGAIRTVKGIRCPMPYLSWYLGQVQNRPVVDRTGLKGFWDFTLEFVPDGMFERKGPDGATLPPPDGPSIYTALRDQLGLKLEIQKTAVDVYVVDHVKMPAAN